MQQEERWKNYVSRYDDKWNNNKQIYNIYYWI